MRHPRNNKWNGRHTFNYIRTLNISGLKVNWKAEIVRLDLKNKNKQNKPRLQLHAVYLRHSLGGKIQKVESKK